MSETVLNPADVSQQSRGGDVEAVTWALASLPACEREAFRLFYEQSLSVRAIAARMHVPRATARGWVHSARERLRGAVCPRGGEERS